VSRRPSGAPSGLLVVDKPAGMTSHDVVSRVRRAAGTRRVGHAGTLDPLATGVLLVGVERTTRLLTHLVGAQKAYTATVRLGASTTTDDAEGEVVSSADASGVSAERVEAAVAALRGDVEQVPSSVSAIKVGGVRSYARVRAGEDVALRARPVTVSRFEVTATRGAGPFLDLDVEVVVSSGTYVRALARDVGAALGVGGHLTALRRTRVASFTLADAVPLAAVQEDGAAAHLLTPAAAAARCFPTWEVDGPTARRLVNGQRLAAGSVPAAVGGGLVAATAGDLLVALLRERDGAVRPELVLVGADDLGAAEAP